MAYESSQACFVFQGAVGGQDATARPSKRRRLNPNSSADLVGTHTNTLPLLLEGHEPALAAQGRRQAFDDLWHHQQQELEHVLSEANAKVADDVAAFMQRALKARVSGQIPTGIITAGLATTASGSLYSTIAERIQAQSGEAIVTVNASQCSNLKNALKSIVRGFAQTGTEGLQATAILDRPRLLNYDLGTVQERLSTAKANSAIIFFRDAEALEGSVLVDLIDVLACWSDRIPFVLLFEIATVVELFQQKLSHNALRSLETVVFEARGADEILDVLFRAATTPQFYPHLYLGPATSRLLLDRQTDHLPSANGFLSALKYMYMMHFLRHPLSFLLLPSGQQCLVDLHAETVRQLASFKRHIQSLRDDGAKAVAISLETDNAHLFQVIPEMLASSRTALVGLNTAIQVVERINAFLSKSTVSWSMLYTKAMSGELSYSPIIDDLLTAIKKTPSDRMVVLLNALSDFPLLNLSGLVSRLELLVELSSGLPIRSTHDDSRVAVEATVVAERVSLGHRGDVLSPESSQYTTIVDEIEESLRAFFSHHLLDPKTLVLHEILIFDSKNATRDALGPSPRANIERALSQPHDYLACECCAKHDGPTATQPATAILYQLYLESGILINLADLWLAFQSVLAPQGKKPSKTDDAVDQGLLAQFYRSLAELKYLGIIKPSRRKADHLAKLRWKGL